MPDAVTIHCVDASFCAASFRDMFLTIWVRAGNASQIRAMNAAQLTFARGIGGQFVFVTVVRIGAVVSVGGPEREAVVEGLKQLKPYMKATAMLIPSSGFAAAIVRTMLAGFNLLRRADAPNKIFESESDAFHWVAQLLAPRGGQPIPQAEVLAA